MVLKNRGLRGIGSMNWEYHVLITCRAVGDHFGLAVLPEVVDANVAQDSVRNLLRSELHFDSDRINESLAYVDLQHTEIIRFVDAPERVEEQRAAFGRLSHTVQDFYAHSNYVDLWLDSNGGLGRTTPEEIDGLDERLLQHRGLRTWKFNKWHFIYYVPILNQAARMLYVAPDSHEARNLDYPARGPKFAYALAAAVQRTRHEYQRAAAAILEAGGQAALDRFHGLSG